ncbi:hypothetical protein M405DRAFT_285147 [Rhizopogon salebrosus TDB-379]|nr:hypothetical protein M405DRAFT_285147 [Rhizopogon salebrosus TDB-379]
MKTMSTSCLFQMQVSTWRLCYLIDNFCPYAPRDDQKCYTSSTLSNTKNPRPPPPTMCTKDAPLRCDVPVHDFPIRAPVAYTRGAGRTRYPSISGRRLNHLHRDLRLTLLLMKSDGSLRGARRVQVCPEVGEGG